MKKSIIKNLSLTIFAILASVLMCGFNALPTFAGKEEKQVQQTVSAVSAKTSRQGGVYYVLNSALYSFEQNDNSVSQMLAVDSFTLTENSPLQFVFLNEGTQQISVDDTFEGNIESVLEASLASGVVTINITDENNVVTLQSDHQSDFSLNEGALCSNTQFHYINGKIWVGKQKNSSSFVGDVSTQNDAQILYVKSGNIVYNTNKVYTPSNVASRAFYQVGGTLTLNGITLDGYGKYASDYNGGAIYVSGGTLNVNCTIRNCTAGAGGAIAVSGGTVNIADATFTTNTANYGAAIAVVENNAAVVNVSNTVFSENNAVFAGGALYTSAETFNADINLLSVEFTDNTATNGGAIYTWSSVDLEDVNFGDNLSSINGADQDVYLCTAADQPVCLNLMTELVSDISVFKGGLVGFEDETTLGSYIAYSENQDYLYHAVGFEDEESYLIYSKTTEYFSIIPLNGEFESNYYLAPDLVENYLVAEEEIYGLYETDTNAPYSTLIYGWRNLIDAGYLTIECRNGLQDVVVVSLNEVEIEGEKTTAFTRAGVSTADLYVSKRATTIGMHAFKDVIGLTGVKFHENLREIESAAFYGCNGITNIIFECSTPENGLVTIGDYAFSYCTGLNTNLSFPQSLKNIGNHAFSYCTELPAELVISGGKTTVDSVEVSYGVENIGDDAFYGCSGIEKVVLGERVNVIGNRAFGGCRELEVLNVDDSNPTFYDSGNCVITKANNTVVAGCKTSVLPLGVTAIGAYAFYGCETFTNNFSLINGIESIGEGAFMDCLALTGELELPGSVITIGAYAFAGCINLDGTLFIPNSVTTIGAYGFAGCYEIESVNFSSSVSSIGDYAFSGCYGVEKYYYVYHTSAPTLGFLAFNEIDSECKIFVAEEVYDAWLSTSLWDKWKAYTFKYSISDLPAGLYESGSNILVYSWEELVADTSLMRMDGSEVTYFNSSLAGDLVLHKDVTGFGENAFANCSGLTTICVSAKFNSSKSGAFTGCTNLINLYVADLTTWCNAEFEYSAGDLSSHPLSATTSGKMYINNELVTSLSIPDSIYQIKAASFAYVTNITSIIIHSGVIGLGDYAFAHCTGLVGKLVIPGNISTIGEGTFTGCTDITSVLFNQGVEIIGKYAFANCTGLSGELVVAEDVHTIKEGAFDGCTSLKVVTMGENVDTIEANAFANCTAIEEYYFTDHLTDVPQLGTNAFANLKDDCKIYVRESMYDKWIGSGNWATYKDHIVAVSDDWKREGLYQTDTMNLIYSWNDLINDGKITIVNNSIIAFNKSLAGDLVISDDITDIGINAFKDCAGLTAVHVPASVTSSGLNAFAGCENLKKVYITDLAAWCNINFAYSAVNNDGGSHPLSNAVDDGVAVGELYLNNMPITNLAIPATATKVRPFTFVNVSNLSGSLTMSDSVTSIGAHAFANCAGLTSVTLGNNIETIGYAAFSGCSGLAGNLNIPKATTTIEAHSFEGCSSLDQILIEEGVTAVGDYAFAGCSAVQILRYNAEISSDYTLDSNVFTNLGLNSNTSTCSVLIGDNVESIPAYLFFCTGTEVGKNGITSVVIGDAVTSIGARAFNNCDKLSSLFVGSSVAVSNAYAFFDCESLTKVYIEDLEAWCKIEFMQDENEADDECSSYPLINAVNGDGEAIGELFLNEEIINNPTIPATITAINSFAFACVSNMTGTLIITDGVESVGNYAFALCSGLTGASIASSVKTVGSDAFNGCSNLENVNVGGGIETIGNRAFANCGNVLTYYFIDHSDTVPTLGTDAFVGINDECKIYVREGMYNAWVAAENWNNWEDYIYAINDEYKRPGLYRTNTLETIALWDQLIASEKINVENNIITWFDSSLAGDLVVAEGITGFGTEAFKNSGLTAIYIPTSLTSSGEGAFAGCSNLNRVYISSLESWLNIDFAYNVENDNFYSNPLANVENGLLYVNNELISEVTIPASVTQIKDLTFAYVSNIAEVEFHDNITSIGNGAFAYCIGLNGNLNLPTNLTTIGISAFAGCGWTGELVLPEGLTTIKAYAFYNCVGFTGTLTIPDSVSVLEEASFNGCTNITFLVIGNGIFTISKQAFMNCGLTGELVIPDNITSIQDSAFGWCSNLTAVTVSESVTNIGDYAFAGCTKITKYYFTDHTTVHPTLGIDAMYNINSNCEIYVRESVYDNWVKATNWVTYADHIVKVSDSWRRAGLFESGSNTLVYTWGELVSLGLVTVNGTAVTACNADLAGDLVVAEGVSSFGENAFKNCAGLTAIDIPATLTASHSGAFSGCTSLTKVYISDLAAWCNIDFTVESAHPLYNANALTTNPSGNTICIGELYLNGNAFVNSTIPSTVTAIKNLAFYCAGNITGTLTIPDSVLSIGELAFAGCTGLTSVNIGNGVTTIDGHAFAACGALESVYFGNKVATVKSGAFDLCTNLANIYITDIAAWCNITFADFAAHPFHNVMERVENSEAETEEEILEIYSSNKLYLNNELITDLVIPNSVETINPGVFIFAGCLTSVTIPSSVKTIGEGAFAYCVSMTNLSIAEGVKFIKTGAFVECFNLTSITIPNSVTTIGASAFAECPSVTSITIGTGVTSIGGRAFSGCNAVQTLNYNANVMTDYTSNADDTSYVFNGIGQDSSTGTCSVVVGDNVTNIPAYLFYNQIGITSVTIGNGVTKIGAHAFDNNTKMTSLTIGNSVTAIGDYAFNNCISMQTLNYNADVVADYTESSNVFYKIGAESATQTCSVVIGDNVSNIPAYLFYCAFDMDGLTTNGITSVVIGDSVTKIGAYAFSCNEKITSITWGDSIVVIGNNAFTFCSIGGDLTLPTSVVTIGDAAFGGTPITSVVIGNNVVSIGASAFALCSLITSISIGTGVTSIGDGAFANCVAVETLNYNANVTTDFTTDSNVFTALGLQSATGTCNVVIGDNVTNIPACLFYHDIDSDDLYGANGITSIVIGSGVETIGAQAFYGCNNVERVDLGSGVKTVGANAFICYNLNKVYITDLAAWCNIEFEGDTNLFFAKFMYELMYGEHGSEEETIEAVESELYLNNQIVTNLVIPESVTVVKDWSFAIIHSIQEVTIHDNVTSIGNNAFSANINITTLSIGESVESIGDNAFNYCWNLGTINIPNSVESVGEGAFNNCRAATSITIGTGVTSIGNSAFSGCWAAESVNYNANVALDYTETSNVFKNVSINGNGCVVVVGNNVTNIPAYLFYCADETEENTNNVISVTIGSGVETIGALSFTGCINMSTLIIGSSVKTIGIGAFASCFALGNINIPNNVETVSDLAFAANLAATNITIGTGVTTIGKQAFFSCVSVQTLNYNANVTTDYTSDAQIFTGLGVNSATDTCEVIFGANVSYVPAYIFCCADTADNANGITSVTIGSSVTEIGEYAFANCSKLEVVNMGESVAKINDSAFSGCTNLVKLNISDLEAWCKVDIVSMFSHPFAGAITKVSGVDNFENVDTEIYLNNELISTLEIPASVTEIKPMTFMFGSNITGLTLHNKITSIGTYAFAYCIGVNGDIIIPDSVNTVDSWAFGACVSITGITIPNSVTTLGSYAFAYCYDVVSLNYDAQINTAYSATSDVFVNLGLNAASCDVVIGDNTTNIPAYLFYCDGSEDDANGITSVTIGNSIETIGTYAFYNCSKVISLHIGTGVTSIGASAFAGCTGVQTLNYNANITTDFTSSSNIFTNIGLNNVAQTATTTLASAGLTDAVTATGCNVVIGDNVENIPAYLFYCTDTTTGANGITSVTIGNNVTTIGESAFYNNNKIERLNLGNKVETIETNVFYGCSELTKVYITDLEAWCKIAYEGSNSYPLMDAFSVDTTNGISFDILGELYLNNQPINNLTIPETITTINAFAFAFIGNMTGTLTIHDNVEAIGFSAFAYCTGLTGITIGSGVQSIGDMAFGLTTGVQTINYNANITEETADEDSIIFGLVGAYSATGTCDLVIGENVNNIPAYMFYTDYSILEDLAVLPTGITSVTFGSNVSTVGSAAFFGNINLSSIYISDLAAWCNIEFEDVMAHPFINVELKFSFTEIESEEEELQLLSSNQLYLNNELITDLVIPNSVETINPGVFIFAGCLTSITIPSSVKTIGEGAFAMCLNVATLSLAEGLETIGNSAFGDCANITNIVIPDSVTTIGTYAFDGCESATEITIGTGVTSIGNDAFSGCTAVQILNYAANISTNFTTSSNVFKNLGLNSETGECIVTIANGATNVPAYLFYCSDTTTSANGITSVTFGDDVETIGESAFYNNNKLTNISLGESIASIGANAFNGCTELDQINIASLESWMNVSFAAMSAHPFYSIDSNGGELQLNGQPITALVIPESITEIKPYIFGMAQNITSVKFHQNVTSIGNCAFAATGLTGEVIIPNSVETIGTYAFAMCPGITSVTVGAGVSSIGNSAFYSCSAVKEYYFIDHFDSIPTLGTSVFSSIADDCKIYVRACLHNDYINDTKWSAYADNIVAVDDNFKRAGLYETGTTTRVELWSELLADGKITVNGTTITAVDTSLAGDLVVADGITAFGKNSFANCANLTAIEIPATLTTSDAGAFAGCTSLTEVYITDLAAWLNIEFVTNNANPLAASTEHVQAVNGKLYLNNADIVDLTIPDTITAIKAFAFAYVSNIAGTLTISDSVTTIGDAAFDYCTGLTRIILGNNVEIIRETAFYGCTGLVGELIIPNSVKMIKESAFAYCSNLKVITIGSGIEAIHQSAFENCPSVTEYYFIDHTESVPTLGTNALGGISENCKIYVRESMYDEWVAAENWSTYKDYIVAVGDDWKRAALYETGTNNLVYTWGQLIANEQMVVEDNVIVSFDTSLAGDLIIPEGITAFGANAFKNCSGLTAIHVPATLTTSNSGAFEGCTSLSKVYITSLEAWLNIDFATYNSYPLYQYALSKYTQNGEIDSTLYLNNEALTSVEIPSTVKTIKPFALMCVTSITDVTIHNGVTAIGQDVFAMCTGLINLTIGTSVQTIGVEAFTYCSALTNVVIPDCVEVIDAHAFYGAGLTSITFGSGLTTIGVDAFADCSDLTGELYIPNSVLNIGDNAFDGCTEISVYHFERHDEIPTLGTGAFTGISDDCIIYVPAGLYDSWKAAANWSTYAANIQSYTEPGLYTTGTKSLIYTWDELIENGIVTVENNVITAYTYTQEAELIIPEGITSIANAAFTNSGAAASLVSAKLTATSGYTGYPIVSVILPESLTTIGNYAFCNCAQLENVSFGKNIASIGDYAFAGCINMLEYEFTNETVVPTIGENVFLNISADGIIYIPTDLYEEWLATSNWNDWLSNIASNQLVAGLYESGTKELITSWEDLVANGDIAISNNTITTVNVSLAGDLVVADGITAFAADSFKNCSELTAIYIPESLTTSAAGAFTGCTSLTKAYITSMEAWLNIDFENQSAYPLSNAMTEPTSQADILNVEILGELYLNNKLVTSVTIPNSITTIGIGALAFLKDLETVTFHNGISEIGDAAFMGSGIAGELIIPEGVTSVGESAFTFCQNITSVTIPVNVTMLGDAAFMFCSSIATINYNANVDEGDGMFFFVGVGLNTPSGCKVIIGDNVEHIPEALFFTYQYDMYLGINTNITEVTIPESVTSIGMGAFAGLVNLEKLYYNANITEDFTEDDMIFIGIGQNNESCEVIIGDNVENIPAYLFASAHDNQFELRSGITKLTVGTNLQAIGAYAFMMCTTLTELHIKDLASWCNIQLADIYSHPLFYACLYSESQGGGLGLTNIYIDGNVLTNLVVPEGVTTIAPMAFAGAMYLSTVEMPASVTNVGEFAFGLCMMLTSISFKNHTQIPTATEGSFAESSETLKIYVPAELYEEWIAADGWSAIADAIYPILEGGLYETGTDTQLATWEELTATNGAITVEDNVITSCNTELAGDLVIPNVITAIGNEAFKNCAALTSITLSDTLTTIGDSAFVSCSALANIGWSSSLTTIGEGAFGACSALQMVNIPASVTSIGAAAFAECTGLQMAMINTTCIYISDYMFAGCTNLGGVFIGDNIETIGEGAFTECENLEFLILSKNLTEIGKQSFVGCVALSDVSFNEGLETIGESAFEDCSGLTTITLPETVTTINSKAFYNCTGLVIVSMPANISAIGEGAFAGCTNIKEYSLMACISVPSIGADALDGTDEFIINVPVELYEELIANANWAVYEDHIVIYDINDYGLFDENGNQTYTWTELIDNSLIRVSNNQISSVSVNLTGKLTIPSSITAIGLQAFYNCTGLTEVVLGDGVTTICQYAFINCNNLTKITFGSGIKTIDNYAFSNCDIKTVNITDIAAWCEVQFNGTSSSYHPMYDVEELHVNGERITTLVIPDSVKTIAPYAFYNCRNIETVVIGNNVTSIGSYAFNYCSNIQKVVMGSNVKNIGSYAFNNCSSLKEVHISDLSAWMNISFVDYSANPLYYARNLYLNDELVTSVEIAEGTTEVKAYTFYNCYSLVSVSLPSTLTSIGSNAFYYCYKLVEVHNLSSLTLTIGGTDNGYVACYAKNIYTSADGSTYLSQDDNGYIIYNDGTNVILVGYVGSATDLTIPEGITQIYKYAFYKNTKITSVVLPSTLTTIGDYAFYSCTALDGEVIIPNKVTTIGSYAFYGCSGITQVTLGTALTTINNYAFQNCYKLVEIYNLSSLSLTKGNSSQGYVAYYAKNIYTTLETDSKISTDENGYVIYNDGTNVILVGYNGTETNLVLPTGITQIYQYALYNKTNITSVQIPNTVTSIGTYAFAGCTGLTSITIPESVTSIGAYAFSGCANIETVYFNANLTTAPTSSSYIFSGVGSATSSGKFQVVFGSNVTAIPAYLFYQNSYLGSAVINEGTTSINTYAFYYCSGLTSVTLPAGLTSINTYAFYGCSGLTSIAIPASVTTIGSNTFNNCSGLEGVYITDLTAWLNIAFGDAYANPLYYAKNLYLNNELVTELTTPTGVTAIKQYAFYNATCLTEVEFIEGVTTIGSSAFAGCTKLTSVIIPSTLTTVNSSAFNGCSGLKGVYIIDLTAWLNIEFGNEYANPLYYAKNLYLNNELVTELTIPEGVTTIKAYAFYNATCLTKVTIPASVTTIASSAFYGCENLQGAYITDLTAWLNISFSNSTANPLYYAKNLYLNNELVTELTIPAGITAIKAYAFYNAACLINVVFTEEVLTIGTYAFYGCKGLTNITIPSSVTSIGNYAFGNCEKVEIVYFNANLTTALSSSSLIFNSVGTNASRKGFRVVFGDGVTSVPAYMFYNNSTLIDVIAPVSIASIGKYAFYGCSALTHAYYMGTPANMATVTVGTNNTALATNKIYFYYDDSVGCLHKESNYWAYDENNQPEILNYTVGDWVVTLEPTCTSTGTKEGTCTVCGETIVVELPMLAHEFENGVCTVCGLEVKYLMTNSTSYPWVVSNGEFSSGNSNKDGTTSTLTITAQMNLTVTFMYKVSSESNFDKLTIKHNSTVLVNAISGSTSYVAITVEMAAGDTLTFSYSKDGSASNGNDKAYIKDLVIGGVAVTTFPE